jgi:putative transposase
MQPSVDRALHQAWSAKTVELGQKQLKRLATSLEREHSGAASSIREGLLETLTLQRLGLRTAHSRGRRARPTPSRT